jgi:signal transduction histidine kinase
VRYVLTAAVSPQSLLDVMLRQRLQDGWVVTAVDRGGARVLRWPRQNEYIGSPVSGTLATMMKGGRGEATGLTTTSEGNDVYTAYSRSPETGWTVALGIPRREVEAVAWSSLGTFVGGVLAALLIGLVAAVLTGRVIVATIAREQAARAEAEGLSRAKDEFLAMLGHELRNPLGAATNAAHLLQAPHLPEPARQRAGEILLRQLHHLARITDDLLDVGRALTGKIALRRQPLDLAAAAQQVIATLRATGRLQRHDVRESLETAWADVDPVRFDQVLTNLLVNAVKFTPEGGHIRVTTARAGEASLLRVEDDGIGMAPELAARAFELFVQGDRAIDRAQGGLGIGLTLVRRLAELHGGSAEVESAGPGRGSRFTVSFPAIAAPAASTGRELAEHAS